MKVTTTSLWKKSTVNRRKRRSVRNFKISNLIGPLPDLDLLKILMWMILSIMCSSSQVKGKIVKRQAAHTVILEALVRVDAIQQHLRVEGIRKRIQRWLVLRMVLKSKLNNGGTTAPAPRYQLVLLMSQSGSSNFSRHQTLPCLTKKDSFSKKMRRKLKRKWGFRG